MIAAPTAAAFSLAVAIDAIHGDASHATVLSAAHVERAGSLIVSAAGLPAVEESFRVAR
jgi:hypothetical protein